MPNYYAKQMRSGIWVSSAGANEAPPTNPDPGVFTYGTTMPVLNNPLNPQPADNVGWNGNSSGGTTGSAGNPNAGSNPVTIPNNTTVSNRVYYSDVILGGPNAKMVNCMIYGGLANPYQRPGIVTATNGGILERCTIYGMAHSVEYWRNALNHSGGVLTLDRCYLGRCVDGLRVSGTSTTRFTAKGCFFGKSAFFNDDVDHDTDPVRPYWTHNDAMQCTGGNMSLEHLLWGCKVDAFFDTTGVTWSGGSWGVGTASITGSGSIGMPHVALNAGFWNEFGQGTWSNGIAFTNNPSLSKVDGCWVNGVNASSGMIMYTGDTSGCEFTLINNKISLGGKPSGGGIIYIVQWPGTSTRHIGSGATANKFWTDSSVPAVLRGTDVPFTSTGAKIDMDNY